MKNFYNPIHTQIYKAFDRHVALDFYREGKIRGKIFTTHSPIFCYKGLTINFVDFVP